MNLIRLLIAVTFALMLGSCTEKSAETPPPFIIINSHGELITDGSSVPVGGRLAFGLLASGSGAAITNLTVVRYSSAGKTIMTDKGTYIPTGGLDTTLYFTKSNGGTETWRFFIMNSNRDTASVSVRVMQGEGSAYGEIHYYPSITIGYQLNTAYVRYIDLDSGTGYSDTDISGNESKVDLAVIWYITSGNSSPTLSAPVYSSITGYYPSISGWPVRNATLFDYKTSDNGLIPVAQFEQATNDSLLVAGFLPESTSGWCKYAFEGRVIPFKTGSGKHGLIRVISADENQSGKMEIAVKIQK